MNITRTGQDNKQTLHQKGVWAHSLEDSYHLEQFCTEAFPLSLSLSPSLSLTDCMLGASVAMAPNPGAASSDCELSRDWQTHPRAPLHSLHMFADGIHWGMACLSHPSGHGYARICVCVCVQHQVMVSLLTRKGWMI